MKKKLLFLCTGNYYRSRFAEIFFNYLAERSGLDWEAFSKGLRTGNPENKGPISVFAIEELKKRGINAIDLGTFPCQVTRDDLEMANLIIALKKTEHYPLFQKNFEDWTEKVEYWHIHDIDVSIPELAIAELEKEIIKLVERLREADMPSTVQL